MNDATLNPAPEQKAQQPSMVDVIFSIWRNLPYEEAAAVPLCMLDEILFKNVDKEEKASEQE